MSENQGITSNSTTTRMAIPMATTMAGLTLPTNAIVAPEVVIPEIVESSEDIESADFEPNGTPEEQEKRTYRTRRKAEGVIDPLPHLIAIATLPNWENGVSLCQQGNAYLQPIAPLKADELHFRRGVLYFDGQQFSEAHLKSMKVQDGIDKLDLTLLRFYYSILLEQFYARMKANEPLDTVMSISFYVPDLVRRLGEQGHCDQEKIDELVNKTLAFHNIIGVIRHTEKTSSYYPVLSFQGFDGKSNQITFESPYLSYLIKEIYSASMKRNKKGEPKLKASGAPALRASHSYLIKPSLAAERNKAAADNVAIIVTLIEQAGTNTPHISAFTIIERNPALAARLKTTQRPHQLLKRVFKKTWELLATQTRLQEVYEGIKLPNPEDTDAIPKMATLKECVFRFPHKGKKPETTAGTVRRPGKQSSDKQAADKQTAGKVHLASKKKNGHSKEK